MPKLVVKRILAFLIDLFLIGGYCLVLFLVTRLVGVFVDNEFFTNPLIGQFIGLMTLTLPVTAYFYFMESGPWKGTIGKRTLGIRVVSYQKRGKRGYLIRNVMKFIPWEIAHTGVHWTIFNYNSGVDPKVWVWILLISPQVVVLGYFLSILASKGQRGFYDIWAGTRILAY